MAELTRRWRIWRNVHTTHRQPGEHLATLGCPIREAAGHCNTPVGLLRYVLVGTCRKHHAAIARGRGETETHGGD